MKKLPLRKTLLLCAIVLLSCVWAIQLYQDSRETTEYLTIAEPVDSIEITRSGFPPLTLIRSADMWYVGEPQYQADPDLAKSLVDAVSTIKILGTVSANATQGEWGLEEQSRIVVKAFTGTKDVRTIHIGKTAVTSRQSYAQMDGAERVVLVDGNLHDLFGKTREELLVKEESKE